MTLQRICKFSKYFFLATFLAINVNLESHSRAESYSKILLTTDKNNYEVNIIGNFKYSILLNLLNKGFFENDSELKSYINQSFLLDSCASDQNPQVFQNMQAGYVKYNLNLKCDMRPNYLELSLFTDIDSQHTHISKILENGELKQELIFTSEIIQRPLNLDKSSIEVDNSLSAFLVMGFFHILSGWDHIAFIVGLVLLFTRLSLFYAITGFTIGHSATLFLGSANIITVDIKIVEILIAFSIFIVGLENIIKNKKPTNKSMGLKIMFALALLLLLASNENIFFITACALLVFFYTKLNFTYSKSVLPQLITIIFGFIHGLGFASNLNENLVFKDNIFEMILGFNLGIEIGQIIIALTVLLTLFIMKRTMNNANLHSFRNILSASLVSIGAYWFLIRSII